MHKVFRMQEEIDVDMECAMDLEESVCEGSEDDRHQQEKHPYKITGVFFYFSKSSQNTIYMLDKIIVLNFF